MTITMMIPTPAEFAEINMVHNISSRGHNSRVSSSSSSNLLFYNYTSYSKVSPILLFKLSIDQKMTNLYNW